MTEPLLHLSHLCRYYQSGETTVKALDDVSLTVWPGEFVAVMGQSGSGKSTLMNIMGCLDRPTAGSYKVHGVEVATLDGDALAALRRDVFGFVFQRYNLLATSTAAENVEIPAMYAGMGSEARHQRARQLLAQLGLGDRWEHKPPQLSGGQQQRVAIARALMNNPSLILADEPTGALDSHSSQEVMALLTQLHNDGRTIVVITHEEEVAAYAERVIRLQDGRLIEDNGPSPKVAAAKARAATVPAHPESGSLTADGTEAVKTALRALRVNPFRTSLTLLGIVIGVAAVVTMMAVGNGSKQKVLSQISAMGTNILNIRPGAPGIRSHGDIATLTPEDAKAIARLDNVEAVVPERSSGKTLRVGNTDYASKVQGVGSAFPLARDWPLRQGTFFTDEDLQSYAAVTVIGSTVAETFFPAGSNPVGRFMLVGNIPFEIIGVMASKGAAPWGGDQDDTVYVPYTTGLVRLFGSSYLNSITVKVADVKNIAQTEEQITNLLRARHGTEDFSVRNTASFLAMATETQNTLTILLGAVAAISLLVGGIGVMNIMLVSVVERTREIGIRMATGARMRDIMVQFNTEAAVVCLIGGVLGVLLGLGAGVVLALSGVEIAFSVMPAVVAFTCAVATGVLFGYLPARKAAQLDPVVALSSE